MSFLRRRVVIFLLAPCLWAAGMPGVAATAGSVFTYRRVFKSSVPEFIEIKIPESSGNASYEIRQLDEDADRHHLKLAWDCARRFSSWPGS